LFKVLSNFFNSNSEGILGSPEPIKLVVIPEFTKGEIDSYLMGVSDYDYDDCLTEINKSADRVDRIVDVFMENLQKVNINSISYPELKYKDFAIKISDGFTSLSKIVIKDGSDNYELPMSKRNIARGKFMIEYKVNEIIEAKEKRLDDKLGLSKEFTNRKLKNGLLQISEKEILDSLLETHPQYFI